MCPSFRATRDERDVTRGRANTLRLAITGQIDGGLGSDAMAETMGFCLSCKACRRECPTGVDMARMKIEVLAARRAARGARVAERIIGDLPRYAPYAAKVAPVINMVGRIEPLRRMAQGWTGIAARRPLPKWSARPFRDWEARDSAPDVLLFADVFNRYFEPENLRAAVRVLRAAGLRVAVARDRSGRALDCGRTRLAVGDVTAARSEARRVIKATRDAVARGVRVVGLEPSSILTFRDEFLALCPGPEAKALAKAAQTFEDCLMEQDPLALRALGATIYVHGHCHQKAQGALTPMLDLLARVPGAEVTLIDSGCCGMAGAFGYGADTIELSEKIAEQDLFPALRAAPDAAIVVADGTSCRHQIADGMGRTALHLARLLDDLLLENPA